MQLLGLTNVEVVTILKVLPQNVRIVCSRRLSSAAAAAVDSAPYSAPAMAADSAPFDATLPASDANATDDDNLAKQLKVGNCNFTVIMISRSMKIISGSVILTSRSVIWISRSF